MIAPTIVMHPLEMMEGGLFEVGEHSLAEMGDALGARHVVVVTGPEMSDEEVIRARTHRLRARKSA